LLGTLEMPTSMSGDPTAMPFGFAGPDGHHTPV
jgi:hypothetical protein